MHIFNNKTPHYADFYLWKMKIFLFSNSFSTVSQPYKKKLVIFSSVGIEQHQ